MSASTEQFDRALSAARQTSPDNYLTQHLRAWSKVDPAAVSRVLRESSLTAEQRESVARELGVTL